MTRDLQAYAETQLMEQLSIDGFVDIEDAISTVEDCEPDFNWDSYCPYYNEQVDVIDAYEGEFGNDADDIAGEKTYTAGEWQQAQTAYAYAIAYIGFNHYVSTAKDELVEALREFESEAQRELETKQTIRVQVTRDCIYGWAAHDRELADGTMIFESGQLDGCNGMSVKVGEVWISCCIDLADESETV